MKQLNKFTFLLASLLCLSLYSTCSKDDSSKGYGGTNFETSCCKIPPLEACIEGVKIYIPNAFTPNGDGVNDLFRVYSSSGIQQIDEFTISQLDGTIIFEENDIQPIYLSSSGWDGQLPDGSISNGVYNYQITISNIAELTATFNGQVCLRSGLSLECIPLESHCAYGLQHNGNGRMDPSFDTGENCQ